MPRTYAKLIGIKLKGDWNKTIDKRLNIVLRQGARAQILEQYKHVPVWRGMSRGSIKFARGFGGALGEYLNAHIPIEPHPSARGRSRRNPEAGGRKGKYNFTSSRHVYQFTLRSDVLHYEHHEFFERPPGVNQQIVAPWDSTKFGKAAFEREVESRLAKIPKVTDYFINFVIASPRL